MWGGEREIEREGGKEGRRQEGRERERQGGRGEGPVWVAGDLARC